MLKEQKDIFTACIETFRERSFFNAYNKTFSIFKADTDAWREHVFRLRYDVYCTENLFIDPDMHPEKLEKDSYDERSEHYLLLHRPTAKPVGTVRIVLPNDEEPSRSFPSQDVCDHPLLQMDSKVVSLCEISRFCMSKDFRKREMDGAMLPAYYDQDTVKGQSHGKVAFYRRTIPYAPLGLIGAAFESALNARITNAVWMVEQRQLWSLKKIGLSYRVLGPHVDHDGGLQPIVFNIKNVLDGMHRKKPRCWEIVTDQGRIQTMADELQENDWQDALIDEACQEMVERQTD